MQSNIFIGNLGKAPTLSNSSDKPSVCRFVLISNEYAGKDKNTGDTLERTVSIRFTAFRGLAETIAKNAHKGDQLIVEYRIENNNYKKEGIDVYDYSFVVTNFTFGAPGKEKRDNFGE